MRSHHVISAIAIAALGTTAIATIPNAIGAAPAPARVVAQKAAGHHGAPLKPKHGVYKAKITRTKHGIPHIVAHDWGSLGFGSGYATARTEICNLADIVITARGQRSQWFGPDGKYDDRVSMSGTNFQVDALVRDLHNRHVVEKLLKSKAGPGAQARAMVKGYAAGVNRYIRKIGGARHITDPACRGAAYIKPNAKPIDIWYGVYLAQILASTGHFLQQMVNPKLPSLTNPNLPQLRSEAKFAPAPKKKPNRAKLLKGLGKDPDSPFGSNATAIGGADSTTHKGMLLGNPHFPWVGRYRFSQQQLTIPGVYNVAGASLIGSPVVNIGWNKNVAWSHTVSTAYRFTPYEYQELLSPTKYVYGGGTRTLEKRTVHVPARRNGHLVTLTATMYRTPQGYVINDPAQFMGWTPLSFWAIRDANGEHLRTIDSFLNMGKAKNVRDLLARQDRGAGIPWVNTIAADRKGNVLYADHSVVPNVSNALAAKCMTIVGRLLNKVAGLPGLNGSKAGGACAWGTDSDAQRPGILGPHNLPATVRTDWVMNANDSYWLPNPKQQLNGYANIIGCEQCVRTLRTRMVDHYVIDALKQGRISPKKMRGFEHQNRVYGAELMSRDGALQKVCQAAKGGDACTALAKWDKHSNINSRGNQIFEEFVSRLPTPGLLLPTASIWKVPFDPKNPVETPNTLNASNAKVVQAMKDAIAYLRSKHIPMNATWGSLHVAGDRGAPPIPIDGGLGDLAGNANATQHVGDGQSNGKAFETVTYGSSHIQAIAFLSGGRVNARTILTYGQDENPKSPWSSDQTRMFSKKQWVHFAFTKKQIRKQAISTITVKGRA